MAQLPISLSSAGDSTVIPAQDGKYISVSRLILSAATETTVAFKSGVNSLSGPTTILEMVLDETLVPWYITNKSEGLIISLGGAVQVGGTIWFSYI